MDVEPTAQPRLLTVDEYLALGETQPGYDELVEGRVVTSPSPLPDHNHAGFRAAVRLEPQLPADFEVLLDLDVDLELTPPTSPGFVRRPDLIVVRRTARERVRRGGGTITASEVLLVVEFLSPGSQRTDGVVKRGEYADAGIPHYWIVDLTEPASMLACHLGGEFGYVDGGAVHGVFRSTEPFAVELDLDALR
ncbi:MAG: Uma2 family endonuclease [Pseudonocardia sp.]|nr:Uma2 family endonuclease [Pseudonocardia sp.]